MSAEPIHALADHPEQVYLDLLADILRDGVKRADRTGMGMLSVFGWQNRLDLAAGFPLLTTKKVHFKSIVVELSWLLPAIPTCGGFRNGVTIWDEWAMRMANSAPFTATSGALGRAEAKWSIRSPIW